MSDVDSVLKGRTLPTNVRRLSDITLLLFEDVMSTADDIALRFVKIAKMLITGIANKTLVSSGLVSGS